MKTIGLLLIITLALAGQVHAQSFLTNGLVAYYPFNGNANDLAGTNNGTVHGAVLSTNRFGQPNSAYIFNGSSSYIAFGAPANLAFTNNFTVSAWCLFSGGVANPRIIDSGWMTGYELLTVGTGTSRQFQCNCGGISRNPRTTLSYLQNVWYSVVVVVQNGIAYFYVNGALAGSGSISLPILSTDVRIGADNSPGGDYWGGLIDDVRLYNRALSSNEVAQLYAYESVPTQSFLTNGLVAYYPFNGDANDMAGTHNGTVHGAVLATNRFGIPNSAYSFNGSSAYIDCGMPADLAFTNNFTLSAWCLFSGGASNPRIIDSGIESGYEFITFGTGASRTFAFGCGGGNYPSTTVTYSANVWYAVVLVVQNGFGYIYVNGVSAGSGSFSHPIVSTRLTIGSDTSGTDWWGGLIDDVRLYNRALSSNEVAQLYAYESSVPPCLPHCAAATPIVTGGFVVAATVTDGGCGYTNIPQVRFIGGGGSGALAVAVVSNGVVTAINVLDAGFGYTNTPLVVIEPPFIPSPVLSIAPMSFLAFSNLTLGGVYQLQQSVAWYWSNQPVSFTATNALYTQMVAGVADSGDYRLALNPVPAQAFATATVSYGFVVHAAVTSGGSGYVSSPAITIVGGGGSNATAVANLSGGVVTSITITSPGTSYTSAPAVEIAQPPAAAVSPTVLPVIRLDSANLAPYDNYQIQFKPALGEAWGNWNGGLFTPTGVTNSQYLFITNGVGFFRLQYVP